MMFAASLVASFAAYFIRSHAWQRRIWWLLAIGCAVEAATWIVWIRML